MDLTVEQAVEALQAGEVIGVPTDTIYGLSSLCMYSDKLYQVKVRDRAKKLVTMVYDGNQLAIEDQVLRQKADEVWPGAVTLIFECEGEMTSFRVPNEPNLLELLKAIDQPIFTTSANISGQEPCHTRDEFHQKFPTIGLLEEKYESIKSDVPSEIYIYQNNQFERIR